MAHAASFGASGAQEKPSGLMAFLGRIGNGLMAISSHNKRLEKIQRLQAMSDDELAELGLTRDTIVHYVFRDLYYI